METVTLRTDELQNIIASAVAQGVAMAMPVLGYDREHTRESAAEFMGDSVCTFDKYKNRIPCVIKGNRKKWLESELIKFRASRTVLIDQS